MFQAVAAPEGFVRALHRSDVPRHLVRAASQWRLDYPTPPNVGLASPWTSVLAAVESILTRGAITIATPRVEAFLEPHVVTDAPETVLRDMLAAIATQGTGVGSWFDSPEERQFAMWLKGVGGRFGWTVASQVLMSSLLARPVEKEQRRVDFVLTHPDGLPIVVELDGAPHLAHAERDAARDSLLAEVGIVSFRIPVSEWHAQQGPFTERLTTYLERFGPVEPTGESRGFAAGRMAHQLQVGLVEAVKGGWLPLEGDWKIGVVAAKGSRRASIALAQAAADDITDMLRRLARVHGLRAANCHATVGEVDTAATPSVVLAFGEWSAPEELAHRTFLIHDFPVGVECAPPVITSHRVSSPDPPPDDVRWFLAALFKKPDFWEGQWEAIRRSLRGEDSVVLLPTGGGKSIAFQLAALLLPGRALAIDPIISLIEDQLDNLAAIGIDRAVGITSQIRSADVRAAIVGAFGSGAYLFCYVAPERLQMQPFRDALRSLTAITPISLVAIDEAHCVSEWGHDFRTSYLNLGRNTREYCSTNGTAPPLVALTGTASHVVLKDVQRELGIQAFDAIITPSSFDRPELNFYVLDARTDEKLHRATGFLERLPSALGITRGSLFGTDGNAHHAGLVFCPFVNGDQGVMRRAEDIGRAIRVPVEVYAGGAPVGVSGAAWDARKQATAKAFKRNQFALLACTKAFGMGIDKPNIRYTLHMGLPESIEGFYQEAGRSGRDRRPAQCGIILSDDDPRRSAELLNPATPVERVAQVVSSTGRADSDDVLRALWFHIESFRGKQAEIDDIKRLLDMLGDTSKRRTARITWSEKRGELDQSRTEKALHRLVVLGVVSDYTVDYAAHEFTAYLSGAEPPEVANSLAQYVSSYQRGPYADSFRTRVLEHSSSDRALFVTAAAAELTDFIYEHIEKARRRSLSEMLEAARSGRNGEGLRERILSYLQTSEYDESLDAVVGSSVGGIDCVSAIADELVSPSEAQRLRGAVARRLTSYPDVPGLLFLRGLAEALSPDSDVATVGANVAAAVTYGLTAYQMQPEAVASATASVMWQADRREGMSEVIAEAVLNLDALPRQFLRELFRASPRPARPIVAAALGEGLALRVRSLLGDEGVSNDQRR